MRNLQPVKFRSIGDMLNFLPDEERLIVNYLRNMIFDCIPECIEKLSYNVPYYYLYSRIFFIWPSSVPWGNVKGNGVQFGFCKGNLLPGADEYLEKGGRKQVFIKTFTGLEDIDPGILKTYIFDAIEVDRKLYLEKTKNQIKGRP